MSSDRKEGIEKEEKIRYNNGVEIKKHRQIDSSGGKDGRTEKSGNVF